MTPMMAQFLEIKGKYPTALLFYRMGDFYELFFDDAVAASAALDIALTKRGKHNGADIPMCGVPHHAAEGYLLTLIRKGFRIAVCEQLESPAEARKRGSKSVVKRDVVRLVTPGTVTEDTILDARRHNFLASFVKLREDCAFAWVDISTGDLIVEKISLVSLGPEVSRLKPSEIIIPESQLQEVTEIIQDTKCSLTPLGPASFDSVSGEKRLKDLFKIQTLEAFGSFGRVELAALGAIVDYLDVTQKGKLPLLQPPSQQSASQIMQIDSATRRNLEITQTLSGERKGSLLSTIDVTATAAGGRLLEQRISSPSLDTDEIYKRLDAIDQMIENTCLRDKLRETLREVADLERALSRIALERASPRDLANIRISLLKSVEIATHLEKISLCPVLDTARAALIGHEALVDLLSKAIVAEPPMLLRDGGFVESGFDADLDEARLLRDEGRSVIAKMQNSYIKKANIQALKIKHNNILGYFIETPSTHAEKMMAPPLSDFFIHRQTTANQVRFSTVELSVIESKIISAASRALEIEKRIFESICREILGIAEAIFTASKGVAVIDLSTSLAELAVQENWVRPTIDDSRKFLITGGRHPTVEASVKKSGATFIPNNCNLNDGGIWLLTGPNMAGKSTFLRQNALIAVLSQMGSFVPATSAHIGIVTHLFSRVGASDDLARGRSTFMVEMIETAAILNQSGSQALVILDEIGRGTATYDGLSIAWATLEHLHQVNQARALFATHYHELTNLSTKLERVENATVAVKEWEGSVVFLHEIKQGAADRSYGVQVAQLAGLPATVVERARNVLATLEKGEREGASRHKAILDDLPLFGLASKGPALKQNSQSDLERKIAEIYPDDLSPKEALQLIYDLKEIMQKTENP